MVDKQVILTFIKNPREGKVKTRLARDIGAPKALKVYLDLLTHTLEVVKGIDAERQLWFSSYIDGDSKVFEGPWNSCLQQGADLGERMKEAFGQVLRSGQQKAVLIGSDCPELTQVHLKQAFEKLDHADLVIGPSRDGGYYLIAMSTLYEELFEGINWSTEEVLGQTLKKAEALGLRVEQLEALNDIDTLADLEEYRQKGASR